MENKVTLNLKLYNELYDFKKDIKENKVIQIYWDGLGTVNYYTINEPVIKLAELNKKLANRIAELTQPKEEKITIEDIIKMNWLQLWRWKRNSKNL